MKNKLITNKIRQSKEYKKCRKSALQYSRLGRSVLWKLMRYVGYILDLEVGGGIPIQYYYENLNLRLLYMNSKGEFEVVINVNGYVSVIIGEKIKYYQIIDQNLQVLEEVEDFLDIGTTYKNINETLEILIGLAIEHEMKYRQNQLLEEIYNEEIQTWTETYTEQISLLKARKINYESRNITYQRITDKKLIKSLLLDNKLESITGFVRIDEVA